MNARVLIYPALLVAAVTIMSGFLEQHLIAFVGSSLTFIFLLLILAALRRKSETSSIPPEFGAKIASLENQTQRYQKQLVDQESLTRTLQIELGEWKDKSDAYHAQNEAYEAALKKAQLAAYQSQGGDEQAVVQFIRNLQKRGRFLDFIMADIHKLPDPQVGSAARVVHQGVRDLMNDYFAVKPIAVADEGSLVEVPKDELGQSYQLLQSRSDELPTQGRLVHKGWQATHFKLPQSQKLEETKDKLVLAPAEIDVGQ